MFGRGFASLCRLGLGFGGPDPFEVCRWLASVGVGRRQLILLITGNDCRERAAIVVAGVGGVGVGGVKAEINRGRDCRVYRVNGRLEQVQIVTCAWRSKMKEGHKVRKYYLELLMGLVHIYITSMRACKAKKTYRMDGRRHQAVSGWYAWIHPGRGRIA